MLLQLGLFPNRKKALRRLRRLVEKGEARVVGTVSRRRGRPETVFCGWVPKADTILHEVQITQLCLRIQAGRVVRGYGVDARVRPDAELWINGEHFFLELDRGTSGLRDVVAERFPKYEGGDDLVLWVCPTEARKERLRAQAGRLAAVALFATFERALASPHDPVWTDHAGGTAALPRQRDGPGEGAISSPGE
jgi:hypothetical protein